MNSHDWKILRELQNDGRLSNQSLAEKVHMSPAACWRRVKSLEKQGIIKGYTALLGRDHVGLKLCAFVHIVLSSHLTESRVKFQEDVIKFEEVLECYVTTGDADFILRVVTHDVSSLDIFLQDRLLSLPQIAQVRSNIALRELKYTTSIPLSG